MNIISIFEFHFSKTFFSDETSIAQLNSEELAAWEYATNFGKYGDTYCSEFDYENLPYASAAKTSPGLLAAFSAFIIFLRQ